MRNATNRRTSFSLQILLGKGCAGCIGPRLSCPDTIILLATRLSRSLCDRHLPLVYLCGPVARMSRLHIEARGYEGCGDSDVAHSPCHSYSSPTLDPNAPGSETHKMQRPRYSLQQHLQHTSDIEPVQHHQQWLARAAISGYIYYD